MFLSNPHNEANNPRKEVNMIQVYSTKKQTSKQNLINPALILDISSCSNSNSRISEKDNGLQDQSIDIKKGLPNTIKCGKPMTNYISQTNSPVNNKNLSPLEVIDQVGQIVAFNKGYAKKLGNDPLAGLFLSQAIYWRNKGRGKDEQGDGWFFKSREDWQDELCITFREQERIRKVLLKTGFWSEDYRRLEHKLYFKIDEALFNDWFNKTPTEAAVFPETTKSTLVQKQDDSLGLNITEVLVTEKEVKTTAKTPLIPLDADSHSVFPQTTKTHFGKQQKRTSYITETTFIDKEYIYKEDELLFYFCIREEEVESSPNYLFPDHKFDLKTLEFIKSRSSIDDKSLVNLIKKFVEYYARGKGQSIAGATLEEWDRIFALNWVDNWHAWNKIPLKALNPSKKDKIQGGDEIIEASKDEEVKEFLRVLRTDIGEAHFKSWFGSLKIKEKLEESWIFTVSKSTVKEWIERNYLHQILRVLSLIKPSVTAVEILILA